MYMQRNIYNILSIYNCFFNCQMELASTVIQRCDKTLCSCFVLYSGFVKYLFL